MKNFNFILLLCLIAGCAYYSTTDIYVQADKVDYGFTGTHLVNGTINLHREMSTEGMRNKK